MVLVLLAVAIALAWWLRDVPRQPDRLDRGPQPRDHKGRFDFYE